MPPTRYLSVTPLQEPYDLGLDEAMRAQCAFNVVCLKEPSGTFLQELVAVLVAAGVGVLNVSIFASSIAVLPDPSKPGTPPVVLHIKSTGGTGPVGTHNAGPGAYRRPGAMLVAHGTTWPAAEAMALAAYEALLGLRNKAVSA